MWDDNFILTYGFKDITFIENVPIVFESVEVKQIKKNIHYV